MTFAVKVSAQPDSEFQVYTKETLQACVYAFDEVIKTARTSSA
jgi:hypothetical protein